MKTALFVCLLCGVASAHPLDMGYLKVETGESIAVSFDLDVVVAAQVLHVDAAKADAALIAAQAGGIAAATYRMATPTVGGEACTWGTAVAQLRGRNVTVDDTLKCPAGTVTWEMPLVKKMSTTFQVLARVRTGDQEQVVSLDKNSLTLEFGATTSAPSIGSSIKSGLAHAGVMPKGLPDGIDHIVFVLALLLGGGPIRKLGGLVGAFGAAHAAGAAIALAGVTAPPMLAAIVPAAGAALAIATVVRRADPWRWVAVVVAGGVHGLATGAASAGSLAGFTLGMSGAMAAIALGLGEPVGKLVQQKRYVVPAAAVVGAVSVVWLVRFFV